MKKHVSPYCAPTRASLLTGRDFRRAGVWHTYGGRNWLYENETILADIFKYNGYAIGHFGKWHLGDNYSFAPHFRGFDTSCLNRIRKVSKMDHHPVTGISEIIKVSRKDTAMHLAGPQQNLLAPRRMVEELYDVVNDPHQIRNLAADSAYQEVLEDFRNTLRYEIIKNADTGFAPEPELIRLSGNSNPFEFARESGQYPLSQILEVCDLMLVPDAEPADLIKYMEHPEGLVRYWAVITAREVGPDAPEVRKRLERLLKDEIPAVQVEAAKLLIELGDTQAGPVIARHMLADEPSLVLFASRAFQEISGSLDSKPEDAVRAYENLKRERASGKIKFYQLYSYWALTYVFGEEG
ncbi:MAG: HEAT repeat domain-containing protein [Anditalea sp.]